MSLWVPSAARPGIKEHAGPSGNQGDHKTGGDPDEPAASSFIIDSQTARPGKCHMDATPRNGHVTSHTPIKAEHADSTSSTQLRPPVTMADRAKREKKAKLDKLAELKRAREGGGRSWVPEEGAELYDEVSEEQYKRIVKGRLAKDDFVVDDGVGGYNDNGMDDWDERNEAVGSDEDDYRSARCVSPRHSPLSTFTQTIR